MFSSEHLSKEAAAALSDRLMSVHQRMQAADIDRAPARASGILFGLGFSHDEQMAPTR
jgi:hypothetical protein